MIASIHVLLTSKRKDSPLHKKLLERGTLNYSCLLGYRTGIEIKITLRVLTKSQIITLTQHKRYPMLLRMSNTQIKSTSKTHKSCQLQDFQSSSRILLSKITKMSMLFPLSCKISPNKDSLILTNRRENRAGTKKSMKEMMIHYLQEHVD